MKKAIIILLVTVMAATNALAQEGFQIKMSIGIQPTINSLDLSGIAQDNESQHFILLGEAQWRINPAVSVGIGTGFHYYPTNTVGTNNTRIPIFLAGTYYLQENNKSNKWYVPLFKVRAGRIYNFTGNWSKGLSNFVYFGGGRSFRK